MSIVSAMELVQGCRSAADLVRVCRLLSRSTMLPVSSTGSRTALSLMETFALGHGLRIPDALIAVTALEHGLPLYTRNVRHLQMIPGLVAVRPY